MHSNLHPSSAAKEDLSLYNEIVKENKNLAKNRDAISASIIIGLAAMGLGVATQSLEPIFFINRTASMPRGIYLRKASTGLEVGDIVVLKSNFYKDHLLKYIVAIPNAEYCFDEEGTLWVEEMAFAKKNKLKSHQDLAAQSVCDKLKEDEYLVVGDHENSLDSRYFGSVYKDAVISRVRLLWAFKKY